MASQPPIPTPASPTYFDYTRAAREANLSESDLRALIAVFEADYPDDLMLRELHVLRACNAVIRGLTTIRQILSSNSRAA